MVGRLDGESLALPQIQVGGALTTPANFWRPLPAFSTPPAPTHNSPFPHHPQAVDLKDRLQSYIRSVWGTSEVAVLMESARSDFKGQPELAAEAETKARCQLESSNEEADQGRIKFTKQSFINVCLAQAALLPNFTLLQNIRPRPLLLPLLEDMACEVLGVPSIDSETRGRIDGATTHYETQHSWWLSAEANAERILGDQLPELVKWLRLNEDSIVANCATENMLGQIDPQLRER